MLSESLWLLMASIVATASLIRAAVVSRDGADLGRDWPGPERRRAGRHRADGRRTATWILLAAFVLVAGVARATGGLDAISRVGRTIVADLGWYHGRGPWQIAATAGAALMCLGLFTVVARNRGAHRRQRLAVFAAVGLTALLAARTISWHDAGEILFARYVGIRLTTWLEMLALLGLTVAGIVGARPRHTIRAHRREAGAESVQPSVGPAASAAGSAGSGATV
jgi:hypothetical protein